MKTNKIVLLFTLIIFSMSCWSQEAEEGDPVTTDPSSEIQVDPAAPIPPASEALVGPAKNDLNPPKTPIERATEAASREMGRVIGRKLGEDTVNRMSQEDRNAILERTRAAIRGDILRRYVFSESPYFNAFYGYVSVMRIGKNNEGFKCLELEADFVYRVERIFSQTVICESTNGEWMETHANEVTFPRRGEPTPVGGGGNGGWLPPL